MTIRIEQDIAACERLWKQFSPKKTLWDEWAVVAALQLHDVHTPLFIVVSEDGVDTGIFPLRFNKERSFHTSFGGPLTENYRFWFPARSFAEVFAHVPDGTVIFDMNGASVQEVLRINEDYASHFMDVDYRFSIATRDLASAADFFNRFSSKHRRRLMLHLRNFEKEFSTSWGVAPLVDEFIAFNTKRFGEKSDYNDPLNVAELKSLIGVLEREGWLRVLSIVKDGVIEGMSMSALHEGTLYAIYNTFNNEWSGLGGFVHYEIIKGALEMGCHSVDFLVGDAGWKSFWHLDQEECRTFRKTPKSD